MAPGSAVPSRTPGPPEALTPVEYGNLLRDPDRRGVAGWRDHALLRVLGDTGLRNAEHGRECMSSAAIPLAERKRWACGSDLDVIRADIGLVWEVVRPCSRVAGVRVPGPGGRLPGPGDDIA